MDVDVDMDVYVYVCVCVCVYAYPYAYAYVYTYIFPHLICIENIALHCMEIHVNGDEILPDVSLQVWYIQIYCIPLELTPSLPTFCLYSALPLNRCSGKGHLVSREVYVTYPGCLHSLES